MSRWPLGDDLELRIFESRDAPELFALSDHNRPRLEEFLPWIFDTHSAADTAGFLESAAAQHAAGLGFHGALTFGGRMIGSAGMHPIDRANGAVALGYWIDRDFEGKGFVTRAASRLVRICFEDYRLHRVEIRCATHNRRSRSIPLRLGFREEGLLRGAQLVNGRWLDIEVYGRIATGVSAGR